MAEQKRDKREVRMCRMCFQSLLTHAEHTIGVHIGCIQDSKSKPRLVSPRYGTKQRQIQPNR